MTPDPITHLPLRRDVNIHVETFEQRQERYRIRALKTEAFAWGAVLFVILALISLALIS
jgi:hypothetical protein